MSVDAAAVGKLTRPLSVPAPNVVRHSDKAVTIFDYSRPRSINDERGRDAHWGKRAKQTAADRERWGWLIKTARLKHMDAVSITVTCGYRRNVMDNGNALPTAKAAIDALKDAGVIDDDHPRIVVFLGFQTDLQAKDDYLALTIKEVTRT